MTLYPFQNPIDEDLDAVELFTYAVEQGCSDIHLKPGSPPKLRITGKLVPIPDMAPLTANQVDWLVSQTQSDEIKAAYHESQYSIDYAWDIEGVGRFRINAFKASRSNALTARKLIDTPPTFEELNTNPVIADLTKFSTGLIFVSGSTGSGKTTLMSAMIQNINATKECHIISTEDPIEILHTDIRSSVTQREVGIDVASFASALKDALREDPDVILIGEIRDEATAKAALRAAETGHLVISTLHASTAAGTVSRFLEIFPVEERESARSVLAGVLRAIVGQRLVINNEKSRTAVNEILLNTEKMQHLINDGGSTLAISKLIETSTKEGMQTFEVHLANLYDQGIITEQVAIEESTYPEKVLPLIEASKKHKLSKVAPPQPKTQKPFAERTEFATEQVRRSSSAHPLTNTENIIRPVRPTPALPPRA